MTGPRHISACISEWLDRCPFNLPDAIQAIRDECTTTPTASPTEKENR